MSENLDKKAMIRYSDMDINQKRDYQKLKKRESRQKMTEEKKEEERNNSKLGMEIHRLELSDEALKYENVSAKHRMRVQRLNRGEENHVEDNVKAKESMRQFREKLPDMYTPRGRKNITEEDDWNRFFHKNTKCKELLKKLKPELAEKFGQMQKSEEIQKEKEREERKKLMSDNLQSCVCTYEFDFCKFCQDQESDTDHHYDDGYTLPNLTEEEVQEFQRKDFEDWKEWRKEDAREKRREKRKLLLNKLLQPIILPVPVKCEYEKIRDDIIAQRRREWAVLEKQWEIDHPL